MLTLLTATVVLAACAGLRCFLNRPERKDTFFWGGRIRLTALWNDGAAFSLPLKRKLVTIFVLLQGSVLDCHPRQFIASFIAGVVRMPLHPKKGHLMLFQQQKQPLPEVNIRSLLLFVPHPAVLPPFHNPALFYRIHHILRVTVEVHPARLLQCFQSFDNRKHLHAVVRCQTIACGKLLFCTAIQQHNAIAAGAWVARTCAVRINRHCFHSVSSFKNAAPISKSSFVVILMLR